MNDTRENSLASLIRADLPASVVVFLVAMPLSLGIALASGAPMMSGLIAAAVGGIVVGIFGGVPLQVSGPAAGLTVMVFGMIETWGFATTCAITVAAGLLQLSLGFLKVARIALAISPAVIHAMLAGIGVLIILSQLHVVLGGTPQSSALANIAEMPAQLADLHGMATVLGLATIAILVAWAVTPLKKIRVVPGPLVAIVGVTVIAELLSADVARIQLDGSLLDAIALPVLPEGNWGDFALAALAMMLVASAESLLCAVATDKMHEGERGDLDKELVGQGLGNTVSGLLGGLPVTGVIVRSTANISTGAKTRLSAILHGFWVLAAVMLLQPLIMRVPLTALAGLLVFVGAKLVNVHHMRKVHLHGEALVYFATLGGVVFINLLAGIGIGIAVAIAQLLYGFSHVEVDVEETDTLTRVTVQGPLTFVAVPKLSDALKRIPPGRRIELDVRSDLMDHAGFEAIEGFREEYERMGGEVHVPHDSDQEPEPPGPGVDPKELAAE